MPQYVFRGVQPHIIASADQRQADPNHLRPRHVWHVNQVQNALGQLSRLEPGPGRDALYAHTLSLRNALASVLEGIDAAILECSSELELRAPAWAFADRQECLSSRPLTTDPKRRKRV